MLRYSTSIFWSEEDEAYVALCPEFPSISALGETAEDAINELAVVIKLAEEECVKGNRPLPIPKNLPEHSGQLRVRLPKSLHASLALEAEREGISLNSLITMYLSESLAYCRHIGPQPAGKACVA